MDCAERTKPQITQMAQIVPINHVLYRSLTYASTGSAAKPRV
jgi:hypothetical protein